MWGPLINFRAHLRGVVPFYLQVIFFSLDKYLTLPWALERSLDLQCCAQLRLKIRIIHSSEEGSQRRKTKSIPSILFLSCFFLFVSVASVQ